MTKRPRQWQSSSYTGADVLTLRQSIPKMSQQSQVKVCTRKLHFT